LLLNAVLTREENCRHMATAHLPRSKYSKETCSHDGGGTGISRAASVFSFTFLITKSERTTSIRLISFIRFSDMKNHLYLFDSRKISKNLLTDCYVS
jgi:hypothetical protein